eukprot:TRINITY_DN45105_c0_g1_i6.p1 TRINITY_DN45105_c0_g1~~TRINITY_DN45105_c0_g1_i6.p1  ORF type:complete len:171 (-),score=7.55 TRINITY_DN45105_c0_g1_i6:29-541(-)
MHNNDAIDNDELNKELSLEEIKRCLKMLQNNKASGADAIINEFLKASCSKLLPIFQMLFNIILQSGKIPEIWSIGFVCPIYKGKGDPKDTDNYRGITILSCFGKLFTSILNQRINNFVELNNLLGQEQAGFRKGYSTMDHVFTLHCIIELYLQQKKKIYCRFVDLSLIHI